MKNKMIYAYSKRRKMPKSKPNKHWPYVKIIQ